MEKRTFPGIGKSISLLGFGLMRLPRLNAETQDIDYPVAEAMIDRALEAGVNYFDTAYPYHEGKSEVFAGQALSRHPRDAYYLATKLPTWQVASEEDLERIFAEQLERCRVDYFDFYLVHNVNRDTMDRFRSVGMYEKLRQKKDQGRIRHLGFSFHDQPALLRELVDAHQWDFVQIQLNYIDWTTTKADELYAILTERNIPVVVMEPVRGGALATLSDSAAAILKQADPGASLASWAIRYAASLPGVMTVLSGMSTPEQVDDNLRTMSAFRPLDERERDALDRAGKDYLASGTIPCTACRYCMDCPAGVDIPRVFGIYNHFRTMPLSQANRRAVFAAAYRALDGAEQAHNCVSCGACVSHCPQGIDIPARMAEVAEEAKQ